MSRKGKKKIEEKTERGRRKTNILLLDPGLEKLFESMKKKRKGMPKFSSSE
jgi:hypothetical protein